MLIATHIGVRESCRPINQPAKAKAEIVAGASQIRIRKYSETASVKAGSGCAQSKATRKITLCKTSRNKAPPKARIKERNNVSTVSSCFPAPNAWAVKPQVPIRRKPKLQYMKLKIIAPNEIAPIASKLFKRPTIAKSIAPNNGTVTLLIRFGIAKCRMARCVFGFRDKDITEIRLYGLESSKKKCRADYWRIGPASGINMVEGSRAYCRFRNSVTFFSMRSLSLDVSAFWNFKPVICSYSSM